MTTERIMRKNMFLSTFALTVLATGALAAQQAQPPASPPHATPKAPAPSMQPPVPGAPGAPYKPDFDIPKPEGPGGRPNARAGAKSRSEAADGSRH